jgi:nucleoside phosphorylase
VVAATIRININNLIDYDVLITGVGMVNTVFSLTKYLHNHTPDLIINVGVAGAYNLDFKRKLCDNI